MTLQQITASDIVGWDSLEDIADSMEKRGLKPQPNLGEDNELVLQLADDEFVVLVKAGPGESATDFKPENRARHTNLVATNDFEEFTFITRVRSWEGQQHGRIKHQKLSFTKEQFERQSGEKNTVLQKLNSIEYGSSAAIYDTLYDTRRVVKEFYEQFEDLRTDLVQEVAGIPNDRGDAKQRYVQVVLDRMIFLYFIQEKRLLDRNRNYLHEKQAEVVDDGGDAYDDFYHPLFFEMLAEGKQDPDFGKLPYLNGGLFSKNPVEEEFEDAKLGDSTERTNELFDDILDFLSDWNWNVDERLDIVDPKNLSPSILGHIFEQTVNQKEMGAYYTPEEITGFMARRTIHPYLIDQLNEAVGAEYEEIDDVFGFPEAEMEGGETAVADGGAMTQQVPTDNVETGHVETLYHDILKEASVLDPAVGSGAFLLAAQEVLLDIYMQCIEFFQRLEEEGKGWEMSSRTRDELEEIESGKGSEPLYAKRTIIINNLYGVDIDDGAVEICKLRLWLSMVADIEDEPREVEPLPNIDFNIRQGNSLIGFTDLVEVNQNGDATLSNYGGGIGDSVKDKYNEVIEAVEKHREADNASKASNWRKEAERRLSFYRTDLNEKVLDDFHDAGIEDVSKDDIESYSPFHWVLEFATVYADGGFDIIIGNPPWEVLKADSDDFFSKYDEQFRIRMPDDKKRVKQELLEDEEIAEEWKKYQKQMEVRAEYFKKTDNYNLQHPTVAGRSAGNEKELSALFLERCFKLGSDSSKISQILPGIIFSGKLGKDLRMHLLDECTLQIMPTFTNRGIFEDIDNRFKFGIVVFENSGETEDVLTRYQEGNLDILRHIDEQTVNISRKVLEQYSPSARLFPYISSQREGEVLEKILSYLPIGQQEGTPWHADPFRELDHNNDSDRFLEDPEEGEYPILGGGNVFQFSYDNTFVSDIEEPSFWSVYEDTDIEISARQRVREKKVRELKKSIYDTFDGTGSQKGFVNDLLNEERGKPLSEKDVKLDCDEYRVAFRQIARANDERTLIATLLPKEYMCDTTLQPIQLLEPNPKRADLSEDHLHSCYERILSEREMLAMLGLLNSIPFDFLMRIKVDVTVVMYKFKESQIPRLTEGDNWFNYISDRTACLNCYGSEFEEMRKNLGGIKPITDDNKRQEVQAEVDAAAFHAYGLNRRDVEFVLNDFHRVQNPRKMTEEYFDMVFEKFDQLEEEGPHP